jgi:DNA-binding NtrC family response regulator
MTSNPEQPDAPLRGRRAVVVDDDRQMLRYLSMLLEDAGCTVSAFDRFEDAKKHLASVAAPDILLTDVRLGAHNGLQLAVLGKLKHPEMLTVVVTAFDDPVLKKDAERAGARYLIKPVSPSELIDLLSVRHQPH